MYIYIYLFTLKYNWKLREINIIKSLIAAGFLAAAAAAAVPVAAGAVTLLAGMLARPGLVSLIFCLRVIAVTLAGVTALVT